MKRHPTRREFEQQLQAMLNRQRNELILAMLIIAGVVVAVALAAS